MKRLILGILFAAAAPCTFASSSSSDYEPSDSSARTTDAAATPYERGKMAVANGNFAEAEKFFTEAAKADARNAEAYNMLAYSQRKQGKLDPAFANYRKALYLHPRFPEAREYLGEAHIQAVLQEIKTLKSYGAEGDEQLRELVAALKAAAEEL